MESTLTWQLLKLYAFKFMPNRHRHIHMYKPTVGTSYQRVLISFRMHLGLQFNCILLGEQASACAKRIRACDNNNQCMSAAVWWNVVNVACCFTYFMWHTVSICYCNLFFLLLSLPFLITMEYVIVCLFG